MGYVQGFVLRTLVPSLWHAADAGHGVGSMTREGRGIWVSGLLAPANRPGRALRTRGLQVLLIVLDR